MRLSRQKLLLVALVLLLPLFCSLEAFSQDAPWQAIFNPAATYHGGDIDYVDMITGTLHIHVPLLVDHSQRGNLNFTYSLEVSGPTSFYQECDDGGGDCELEPAGGVMYPLFTMDNALVRAGAIEGYTYSIPVVEDSGGVHFLGDYNNSSPTATLEALDGSGIQFRQNSSYNHTLINGQGVQFYWPSSYTPGTITDPNGNQLTSVTIIGAGPSEFPITLTDTLGRSWTKAATTDFSHCPGSPISSELWNTPGPDDSTRVFQFCYSMVSVATDLGEECGEAYSGEFWALTAVVLPDLTVWQFDYDTYGNMQTVHMPTGGTISYTYNNSSYGVCGLTTLTSRTVSDGTNSNTWTYPSSNQWAEVLPSGPFIVTDPQSNDTAYYPDTSLVCTSSIYYRTSEIKYYSGSASGGTLLKTEDKTYQEMNDPYPTYMYVGGCPDMGLPASTTTTWSSGQISQVQQVYDNGSADLYFYDHLTATSGYSYYGLVTSQKQSDYYTGSPTWLSTTNTSYLALSNSSYLGANILSIPSSVSVVNGSGYLCAETDYGYDASRYIDTSSGATQHVSAPTSGILGDLTSVTRKLFTSPCTSAGPSSTSLTTNNHVYDTGMLHTSTDPLGNTTTYLYSSSYYDAYPTTVTNALGQSTTYTYDFNTGLPLTMTDPNLQETTYSWDCMLRPSETLYPNSGEETWTYNYTGGSGCGSGGSFNGAAYSKKINSSLTYSQNTTYDGLGRNIQTGSSVPSSTCSGGYTYVDTTYDEYGRTSTVSNPDCTSSSSDDVTTTYSYDPLSRVTEVLEQDGSAITTSYTSFPCTTVTDEASKVRKSCVDGAGRMTGVWEDPSTLNYETDYSYDANGNLTQVQQKGGASSTYWRTRTFTYDSLSRLLTASNPELGTAAHPEYGTVSYGYDDDGNLHTRTTPQANQTGSSTTVTSYCYDATNRLIAKKYDTTSHSCSLSSPDVSYVYDGNSVPSGCSVGSFSFGSYPIGNRTAMCDAAGSEAWLPDKMGRPLTDQRITNSVTESTTYTYNYDGTIATLGYPSGRTITYGVNIAEQPTSAEDTTYSITYANTALYTPFGALSSLTNGSSTTVLSSLYYNSRLQPCRFAVNGTGTAPGSCTDSSNYGNVLDVAYNFNLGSTDNGNVASIADKRTGMSGRSVTYTYDALNRISEAYTDATTGSYCWGEAYTIDPWANLTAIDDVTSPDHTGTGCTRENLSLSATPTAPQNQLTTGTTPNFSYDAAGNMTNDLTNSYTYDPEGHIAEVNGTSCTGSATCYVYDGDGKRVEKAVGSSGAYELYWYDTNGNVLDETDQSGSTSNSSFFEYVFLGGQRIARRDSSDNILYYFADHLGTSRALVLAGNTSYCYDADFYPYGGERNYTNTCSQNYKFTGKERDSESGLDNFGARYMSSQYGRFMSPDPMGGHFMNPQSLNRYAYVHNNPLKMIDPTGLDCVYTDNLDSDGTVTVQQGDCTSDTDNGIYVNGTVDLNSFNLTQDDNGDLSLNFGYTNDDTGLFSLYQTNLPGMSGFNNFDSGFGFGSPQYAAQLFSQVYQNTRAVTNPANIGLFYGASAATGAGLQYIPGLLSEYGPQALANLDKLLQTSGSILQQIALDPGNIEFVTDAIQGYTPGAVPATLGGLAGFAASEIQSHWSQISQGLQNTYQQVKGSVPH